MFLTTVAVADHADDVEAVVREHFATLNAGDQDAHLHHHHIAEYNRFTLTGLRWHFDSVEEQSSKSKPYSIRVASTTLASGMLK